MSIRTSRDPLTGLMKIFRRVHMQPIPYAGPVPYWTVAPSISGTYTVGQTLTANGGTYPFGTLTRQWLLNGVPISGATASTYVLVAGDTDKTVTAEFRLTEGNRVKTQTVPGGVVAGSGSISWPSNLNPAHVSMTELTAGTPLGHRQYTFSASVSVPSGFTLYLTDPTGTPGGILATTAALVGVAGATFPVTVNRTNAKNEGDFINFNPFWHHIASNTFQRAFGSSGTLATGQTITPVVGDTSPGEVVYEITRGEEEPEPPTGLIGTLSAQAKADAIALPNARHILGSPSATFFDWGNPILPLSLAAFKGDTSVDAEILERIRHIFNTGANQPTCDGRVQLEYDNQTHAACAIALKIPRIKAELTSGEILKVERSILAGAAAGGNICSNTHVGVGGKQRTMRGNIGEWVTPNPNIAISGPVAVLIAICYYGSSYMNNFFNTYDHVAFRAQLNSAGLVNAYTVFNFQAAGTASGKLDPATSPTPAMMHTGLRGGWSYSRASVVSGLKGTVSNWKDVLLGDRCLPWAIWGPAYSGYDEGRGTVTRPSNTPNGQGKAMSLLGGGNTAVDNTGIEEWLGDEKTFFYEMTGGAIDAEGQRSSPSYSLWTLRQILSLLALMAVTDTWDRNDAGLTTWINKWNVAMKMFDVFMTRGYKGWAHNGKGDNGYDVGYLLVRAGSYGATGDGDKMRFTYGLRYVMSIWRDVLVPYYGLPAWD